jgi:rod shape-determining protein MreD
VHLYLYIIFIITLPINISRELVLLIGFLLGISIDIFSNTFGMHAFATVFAAFFRFYLLKLFASKDDHDELVPSIASFGLGSFFKYSCLMVIIHHTALFLIDYFSFAHIGHVLLQVLLSSAFTLLILMAIERFKTR